MDLGIREATTTVAGFAVALGHGAQDRRTADGADALRRGVLAGWAPDGVPMCWSTIAPSAPDPDAVPALEVVGEVCARLGAGVARALAEGSRIVVLGGDHSCAVGTWSGAANARADAGDIGLVWIDAHMDSHTPETTPSGTWHGMPVALLLGHGEPRLVRLARRPPAVPARHFCLVGPRSFEPEEPKLLARAGVRVIDGAEVAARGLGPALAEAIAVAARAPGGFGISLDLDALDPEEAPGVGSPAPRGLSARALAAALSGVARRPGFLGIEIAEYNPARDRAGATAAIVGALLAAAFDTGRTS